MLISLGSVNNPASRNLNIAEVVSQLEYLGYRLALLLEHVAHVPNAVVARLDNVHSRDVLACARRVDDYFGFSGVQDGSSH